MKYIKEYKEHMSDNFWKWFGKSKIVDDKGNPTVCYHGTNYKFDKFNKNTIGSSNDGGFYGRGFYFTHDPKYGKDEARYYGNNIMEVYLKVEKPFDFDKLTEYKGVHNGLMFYQPFVFLYNIANMFPELSNKLYVNKTIWNEDRTEGEVEKIPISEFAKLVDKYENDIKIIDYDNQHGDHMKTGYVKSKSKIIKFDERKNGGRKGEFLDYDTLGDYSAKIPKEELEFGLIIDAIKNYEDIDYDYLIEGTMTRNPQITDAIMKKHDGIIVGDEIVVFEPTQIKSVNNNGDFSINNDNINENNN